MNMQSVTINPKKLTDNELSNMVSLAKKALEASKEAASLADSTMLGTDLDFALSPRFVYLSFMLVSSTCSLEVSLVFFSLLMLILRFPSVRAPQLQSIFKRRKSKL